MAATGGSSTPRGIVIGQAPPGPPESLPPGYRPLQGPPETRLAKLAGLSRAELWLMFDRIDLIGWYAGPKHRRDNHLPSKGYRKHNWDGHKFPIREARLAASRLARFGCLGEQYALVVLCGRNVANAFGLKLRSPPWTVQVHGTLFLVMPHPSGVSHFWNDQRTLARDLSSGLSCDFESSVSGATSPNRCGTHSARGDANTSGGHFGD